jgi:hypothetical protein
LQRSTHNGEIRLNYRIADFTVHAYHLTRELKERDPAYGPLTIIILARHPPQRH